VRTTVSFNIYEIEHSGDEDDAISQLRAAGATDIKVVGRDHEGEESMRVQCVLPDGVTWSQFSERTELCL
jgi:hypothetical protein